MKISMNDAKYELFKKCQVAITFFYGKFRLEN